MIWTGRNVTLLFCFLMPVCLSAQYNAPENRAWAFGKGAGLLFTGTGTVTTITTNQNGGNAAASNMIESNASVADHNGNLLFYSNGTVVWDRAHNLMPGSTSGLHGQGVLQDQWTGSATQGALIVPMPDSAGKYYLFSLTGVDSPHDPYRVGRLYYSVIDMSLNNGMGDVVPGRKWVTLDSLLSEKMIGISGDCNNVWLLVHARDTNAFKAYEITHNGISGTPVYSYTGSFGHHPFTTNGITQNAYHSVGEMKVSPDRKKLVACWGLGGNFAALYDFDVQTGQVRNELSLHAGRSFYGAAFSPDNSKVYVADAQTIWQYNLTAANIPATRTNVGSIANNAASGLRLAPDGKVYVRASPPQNHIGAIQQPNLSGTACSFVAHELTVAGTGRGILTFPNEVAVPRYPKDVSVSVHADTLSCHVPKLRLQATAGFASYLWNDGLSGSSRTVSAPGVYWVQGRFQCDLHVDTFFVVEDSGGYHIQTFVHDEYFSCQQPGIVLTGSGGYRSYIWDDGSDSIHRFTANPGVYWVRMQNFCEIRVDTFIVTETQEFQISLGNDTVICEGQTLVLDAGAYPGARYNWQDGSTESVFEVTRSGTYHVRVTNGNCSTADTVVVRRAEVEQHLGADLSFCRGEIWEHELHARIPDGDVAVLWSTGAASVSITARDSGIYWVTVTDGQCTGTDTVRITEEMCVCAWMIPHAFTPNGDGRNDQFRVVFQDGCPVSQYQMRIYDRWGRMVYATTDPQQGWDGRIAGQPASVGVYMYEVSFVAGTHHKRQSEKGDLTLIR